MADIINGYIVDATRLTGRIKDTLVGYANDLWNGGNSLWNYGSNYWCSSGGWWGGNNKQTNDTNTTAGAFLNSLCNSVDVLRGKAREYTSPYDSLFGANSSNGGGNGAGDFFRTSGYGGSGGWFGGQQQQFVAKDWAGVLATIGGWFGASYIVKTENKNAAEIAKEELLARDGLNETANSIFAKNQESQYTNTDTYMGNLQKLNDKYGKTGAA